MFDPLSSQPSTPIDNSHVLPDVLAHGLSVVFCGTAAGETSARRRAYYAGPGNAFWPTLYKIGLTHYQLRPEEFRSVVQYGIGLTDLAKYTFGPDQNLSKGDFDRQALRSKVLQYSPKILAFTSKASAKAFLGLVRVPYGLLEDRLGETRLYVLPSPSGAARGYWDLKPWMQLAELASGSSRSLDKK